MLISILIHPFCAAKSVKKMGLQVKDNGGRKFENRLGEELGHRLISFHVNSFVN